jgi:hypothetical protein
MDNLQFNPNNVSSEPQLNFDPDQTAPTPVPEPVATERAAKAYMGVKKDVPDADYADIRDSMLAGYEKSKREQYARAVDVANEQRRYQSILKVANLKGGALTQEDINQVDRQLNVTDLYNGVTDPRSVYEEKYAHAYLSFLNWPEREEEGTHWLTQAKALIPDEVQRTEAEASDSLKWFEYVTKRTEDVQAKKEERGIGATIGSMVAGAVPFLNQYMLRGNVPYSGFDLTTSGSLEDQRRQLLRLPFNERKDRFDAIMDNLESYNLDYAEQFGSAMTGQSFYTQALSNLSDIMDISSVPAGGVSKSLVRKVVLYNNVRQAYKSMTASAIKPREWSTPRLIEVTASNAAGNMEHSAVVQESSNAINRLAGRADPGQEMRDSLATVFTGHRDNVGAGPGRYGQEIVNRIQESYDKFTDNFVETMQNIMRVERIPAVLASEKAVQRILDGIKDEYPNLQNSIINQSEIYWNQGLGTYASDLILARADGTLFRSQSAADVFGNFHRLRGYTVEPSGSGFVMRFPKPVKENTPWLRDALLTGDTKVPDSAAQAYTSWMGWARTPDETLAAQNTWNRKTAVYAQNVLRDLYKKNAESLLELEGGKLGRNRFSSQRKQQAKDFHGMVDNLRNQPDAQGRLGKWLDHPADVESYYQTNFNRAPSQLEIAAYFDFKRSVMMDWALRNIELHKLMSRVGTEEWRVSAFRNLSDRNYSNWLHGVKEATLPPSDAIVMMMGKNVGDERVFRGSMPSKVRADIKEKLTNGELTMVRLYEPGHYPLNGWSPKVRANDRIEYVISNKMHNRPLSFDVLPKREGGHVEYDFEHYIKQARIVPQFMGSRLGRRIFQHWYEGDTTVMGVQLRALGEDGAKILNQAREHLRLGNEAEARSSLSKLPIDYKEFRSWFKATARPDGTKLPPRLSLSEPFHVVPKDRMVGDLASANLEARFYDPVTGKSTFRDGTKEGSLARQNTVPFTQERDTYELYGLGDKGSRYKPLYKYEPAHKIDPIVTMNRGLNRIVNSTYMNDYKLMSIEHWLQQAHPYLDKDLNALRSAPMYYFHHADNFWKKDSEAIPQIRKMQIAAKEIKVLLGEPSLVDNEIQRWTLNLADQVYGANNPFVKGGLKFSHWGLSSMTTAANYTRAAVFHSTLGLFHWVQAIVQNLTYVNIFGIAGFKNALKGTLGATLHQMSRMAGKILPDVIDHLDRTVASKMGWRPGELREAHDLLARTGFSHVGGEHILQDYNFEPTIFKSTAGKFLDAGEVFFKGGERHMRFGAWYTAYKEFRDVRPTGPVSNEDLRGILARADLLSGNMSVASKSALQRGPLAFSTQFLGYQLRMAELMTGKRLTPSVKAKMFLTNAVMFGIPVAVGTSVPFWPMAESIRQYAISHDYVVGDSWYQDMFMNGLPAYVGAVITGGGDAQQGTQYNIGDRYGSPGVDIMKEAIYDRKFWELLTGAAGQSISESFSNLDGFRKVVWSLVHDGGKVYPYTDDMVIDAFRQIASVNSAWKGYLAITAGVWQTKKGITIENVPTVSDALIRTLMGLSSQEASDVIRKSRLYEDQQEIQKYVEKQVVVEIGRAARDVTDRNFSDADKHFAKANALMDASSYPRALYGRILEQASTQYRDLIDREDWNYYLRNIPAGQEQNRMEAFEKIQRLKQLRGQ